MQLLRTDDDAAPAAESGDESVAISGSKSANAGLNEVTLVTQFLEAANNTDVASLERLMEIGIGVNEDLVNAVDQDGFSALVRANELCSINWRFNVSCTFAYVYTHVYTHVYKYMHRYRIVESRDDVPSMRTRVTAT